MAKSNTTIAAMKTTKPFPMPLPSLSVNEKRRPGYQPKPPFILHFRDPQDSSPVWG